MKSYLTAPSSATIIEFNPPSANPAGRFVRLRHDLLNSPAWQNLPPGPRALYIEIAGRHDGRNNGRIPYSERDGAAALRADRRTVRRWFDQLEEPGIAVRTSRGSFDFKAKEGKASLWYLPDLDGNASNRTPQLRSTGHNNPQLGGVAPLYKNRCIDRDSRGELATALPKGALARPEEEINKDPLPSNSSSTSPSLNPPPSPGSARPPSAPRWRTSEEARREAQATLEHYRQMKTLADDGGTP
jgi:hypothetical protein